MSEQDIRRERWLQGAGSDQNTFPGLMKVIRDRKLTWTHFDDEIFGGQVSGSWLDGVIDMASEVRGLLTYEPRWPSVLESRSLLVMVEAHSHIVGVWASVRGVGGMVSFSSNDFSVNASQESPAWRYIAGLGISWFVDNCIRVRRETPNGGGAPPMTKRLMESSGVEPETGAVRYTPHPAFDHHIRAGDGGETGLVGLHRVRGAVRTLPPGSRPSPNARANAPERLRGTLTPGQTYVRGHSRGNPGLAREIETRLSSTSALADALRRAALPHVAESWEE